MSQRRVELGLRGGAVLRLTIEESAVAPLTAALAEGGWYEIASDDDTYSVNSAQVQYVRVLAGDPSARVGFGD